MEEKNKELKRLHLGCGRNYKEGWINLDINKNIKADIYHDLAKPLPFEDNTFDRIYSKNVLEHIAEPDKLMQEIWRVLKNGGVFEFEVPFANSFDSSFHVCHRCYLTPRSFSGLLIGKNRHERLSFEMNDIKFKKKYIKLRLMVFHIWLPEWLEYLSIFANIFVQFKGEFIAIK